jgi:alanyl-tRNA synthetase
MTDRLYYHDSFLYDFDAEVCDVVDAPRPALILDRSAFYPTSGGQIHDTGWITAESLAKDGPAKDGLAMFRVAEVADAEDGRVVHYLEAPVKDLRVGGRVYGQIDLTRRRDHMQQHSGQHVLSAAFLRLHGMATVSFHMADDYCSIDLNTPTLSKEQIESAERLANESILENRAVDIRFVTREEAASLGLRKVPVADRDELRIVDIRGVDVSACGGTHVAQTGQIGCILLRKFEKVRQGWRVEFVAGQRGVATARRDFTALAESAVLFSAHLSEVPQQARKALEEIRSSRKQSEHLLEELAAAQAANLLTETPESNGRKLIVRTFADRDLSYLKLLAQKLTRAAANVVALIGSASPQPSVVFAQSAGQPHHMGALMKEITAKFGGRGGGSKDMAQGGLPTAEALDAALAEITGRISAE